MKKKIGIFVTVYKHRTDIFLKHLNEIRKDIDVYIVTQENDPALDEYNQYISDNVFILSTKSTSIFEKREAIRNFAIENGYDGMIQIDDDIDFAGYRITDATKRSTSKSYRKEKITFDDMLQKMLDTVENENAGFVSFGMETYLSFMYPGKMGINKGITCSVFVYIDCHALEKYDIHYDTTGAIHEDVDMVVKLLQNGVKCVSIMDYSTVCGKYLKMEHSSIYKSTNDLYRYLLNQYVKWHFPLYVSGKDKDHLAMKIPFAKIFNTHELQPADEELLKLCMSGDVNAVIEYIKYQK